MTQSHDEWRERLAGIKELKFPEALRHRILDEASRREASGWGRPRPVRAGAWKSWLAGMAGVCAAAVMAGLVWTDQLPSASAPAGVHSIRRQEGAAPLFHGPAAGLKLSPLIATGLVVIRPATSPGGPLIQATVTNIGKATIFPKDIVGVLGFTQQPEVDLLSSSDWIDFVNGPSQPLAPGDTATWTFNPIGVPVNAQGQLVGQPSLTFFDSKLVTPSQADKTLTTQKGADLQDVTVVPRQAWKTGRSFEVTATLVNHGSQPIALNQLLSVVWFAPQVGEPWTQPNVERFFDQVQAVDPSVTKVAPGQSARIVLPPLIGSRKPNFLQWTVNVAVIGHHW